MAITWQRTFAHKSHDFAAYDGAVPVGRIYRENGGPSSGRWLWSAHGIHASSGTVGIALNGMVATRREAIDSVKAAWAHWLALQAGDADIAEGSNSSK